MAQSMTSWLVAPQHVARGSESFRDVRVSALTRGMRDYHFAWRPRQCYRDIESIDPACLRDRLAALRGSNPPRPRRAAGRCLEIQHVLEVAASSQTARMAALENIVRVRRQGVAHDTRDLTIPAASANPASLYACAALRICIAPHPIVPFIASGVALLGEAAA